MRENWRWDSTATASSSQPDISLPFPLQPRLLLLLHRELLLCPSCLPLFSLLLLILLQLLKILICLVEHLLLSKNSFFPYILRKRIRRSSVTAPQLQTCDVTMQCAPKEGGEMILTILVAQYLSETFILLKKWRAAYLHQNWDQIRWARILSQLNSIVLIIAKSQYFQLILYEMLILLGNGIIQQPISYYHWIYALL